MGSLLAKTILGFLFLMVVLALALFLSAGSLAYWQAWVYLAVFALCTILISTYLFRYDQELLAGRVRAGPIAETHRSQQIVQGIASLCFLALYIVAGLDDRFGWSNVPPAISLAADGLVALGFSFVFLVFRENSYSRGTIEVSTGQRVISTGPYSLVRHPMYAGAMLLVFATGVALGSWVAVPFAVPLLLVIVIRLLDEEKFLRASLPGYDAYCRQVPRRLVPYLW